MTDGEAGTNGGGGGTSGARRRAVAIGAALFLLVLAARTYGDATSMIADFARDGVAVPAWRVWAWETTSVAALLALLPGLWWLVAALRPPRFGWAAVAALHLAATLPFSLLHVALMLGLRVIVFRLAGDEYHLPPLMAQFGYEYRKDLATYLQLGVVIAAAMWWLARPAVPVLPLPVVPRLLLVPEGSAVHRVPIDEIDHVAAAGNYVELAWRGRTLLHRATLAAVQGELGDAFARIHRSRLVRRAAIRRIDTDRSGDFATVLESGAVLRGSRRYRGGLG